MRGKSKNIVLLCLICFSSVLLLTAAGKSKRMQDVGEEWTEVNEEIIIPTVNDVRLKGYPKNEMGETYGPDVKELDNGPDLVLVRHAKGYGYIRQSEMDNDGVESPEDAAKKMSEEGTRKVNVYLQDGTTCIGTFDLKEWGLHEKDT